MYETVFRSYGIEQTKSPPQPVDERDIVSSTRTLHRAWYVDKFREEHTLTFNTEPEAQAWLDYEFFRLSEEGAYV